MTARQHWRTRAEMRRRDRTHAALETLRREFAARRSHDVKLDAHCGRIVLIDYTEDRRAVIAHVTTPDEGERIELTAALLAELHRLREEARNANHATQAA